MKKIAAIIPSRYHSTRFEGKPLALIKGIPMIERVYRQVEKCGRFEPSLILVATDDERILSTVRNFGGNAVMTSPDHQSGSERLWEAVQSLDVDALINIQGDEPAIPISLISNLHDELSNGSNPVVTPAYINPSYDDFLSPHDVKVVINNDNQALYFSRSPIPYYVEKDTFNGFYHHIGMYGYSKEALKRFVSLEKSKLERLERLEQLRFLENNMSIKVIITKNRSIGVDVPEDVARVEKLIEESEK